MGVGGLRILRDIVAGHRDPQQLARRRDPPVVQGRLSDARPLTRRRCPRASARGQAPWPVAARAEAVQDSLRLARAGRDLGVRLAESVQRGQGRWPVGHQDSSPPVSGDAGPAAPPAPRREPPGAARIGAVARARLQQRQQPARPALRTAERQEGPPRAAWRD